MSLVVLLGLSVPSASASSEDVFAEVETVDAPIDQLQAEPATLATADEPESSPGVEDAALAETQGSADLDSATDTQDAADELDVPAVNTGQASEVGESETLPEDGVVAEDADNDAVVEGSEDSVPVQEMIPLSERIPQAASPAPANMIMPFASGNDDVLVGAQFGAPTVTLWGHNWDSPNAHSIAWIDMTGFNQTLAGSSQGQNMSIKLSDRYTMTFNVRYENSDPWGRPRQGIVATTSTGFQFNGVYYPGLTGRPVLYQTSSNGTQSGGKVTLRNISVVDNANNEVSYSMVMTDGELTSPGEHLRVETDTPINYLELLPGQRFTGSVVSKLPACQGGTVGGIGQTNFECRAGTTEGSGNVSDYAGIFVAGADNPSYISGTFGNTRVGTSRQGIAFGVMISGAEATSTTEEFAQPGDSFSIEMSAGNEEFSHSADGAKFVGTGKKILLGDTSGNPIHFTQKADGNTNGSLYRSDWTCKRNGVIDPALSVSDVPFNYVISTTYALGDFVECHVVNRVGTLTVSKAVSGATGTPAGTANPGDELTYAITFSNAEKTAAVKVQHLDNLVDVLEHAEYVPGSLQVVPTDSNLQAQLVAGGSALAVTGQVDAGKSVTVTYRVLVNAQVPENQELINVVTPFTDVPTDPPAPPTACDPVVEVCTITPITPTQPHLLSVYKDLPDGRLVATDQFEITLTEAGSETAIASATTRGEEAGLQTETAPDNEFISQAEVTAGESYTISETAAPGLNINMDHYVSSWVCTDPSNEIISQGDGTSGTFTMPDYGFEGGEVVCVISNNIADDIPLIIEKLGEAIDGSMQPFAGSEWEILASAQSEDPVEGALVEQRQDELGQFNVTGLKAGTYWLKETKAPTGFSLLAQPVEFTLNADGSVILGENAPIGIVNITANQDGTTVIQVIDVPRFDLPDSGGSGTLGLYFAGVVLLFSALGLSVVRMRRV